MTTTNPNKPAAVFRDGAIKVNIWANETDKGIRYSAELSRSYTDQQGQWHDTKYLSNGELLRAANLLVKAYNRQLQLKAELKSGDTAGAK